MGKKFKDLAAPLYGDPESKQRMAEIRSEMEAELVAHHLGELRRALGVDQTELARRLGMTQGGLSRPRTFSGPETVDTAQAHRSTRRHAAYRSRSGRSGLSAGTGLAQA